MSVNVFLFLDDRQLSYQHLARFLLFLHSWILLEYF